MFLPRGRGVLIRAAAKNSVDPPVRRSSKNHHSIINEAASQSAEIAAGVRTYWRNKGFHLFAVGAFHAAAYGLPIIRTMRRNFLQPDPQQPARNLGGAKANGSSGSSDHRRAIDVAKIIELANRHRESMRATAKFMRLWNQQSGHSSIGLISTRRTTHGKTVD